MGEKILSNRFSRSQCTCAAALIAAVLVFFSCVSPVDAHYPSPQDRVCPSAAGVKVKPQRISYGPCKVAASTNQAEQIYTVKRGDSLAKIADRYNISFNVLLLANPGINNPSLILVNQKIHIPSPAQAEQLMSQAEKQAEQRQQKIIAQVNPGNSRWVDVDLASQKVRVYTGSKLVRTFVVSTGVAKYPTVTGQYNIWVKMRYDDMRGPGYNLKNVPYVMYFYKGFGLHGTYWHHNFGTPMSHGCVNLKTEDAAWLYNYVNVGTLVNIH